MGPSLFLATKSRKRKSRRVGRTGIARFGLVLLAALVVSCYSAPSTREGRTAEASPSPARTAASDRPAVLLSPLASPSPPPTPVSTPTAAPSATVAASSPVALYTYRVVNVYPHDPDAFTQGLVFDDGVLYESTGLRGRSSLRMVEWQSGTVQRTYTLPEQYFGEGLTLIGDRLIQLTWQSHVGFVYDKDNFDLLDTFEYTTEGWGITHDGQYLIMSDGTEVLHFLDPGSLQEVHQVQVYGAEGPVAHLNELEYVQGEVYANVWLTDWIVTIDPHSGWVTGWLDLAGLLGPEDRTDPVDVLNGIAYDAEGNRLFVTGKLWPKLFEIELVRTP